jgi:hypothetical protein
MSEQAEADRPHRAGAAKWILAGLVAAFGAVMFVLAVRSGRADSAMLFVGLPALLAVVLVLLPGRTTHGRVFQLTTVGLLVAAVALHEGAICVILAAPLVYAVAHGMTALVKWLESQPRRYAVLPVVPLLLLSGEGVTADLRVDPAQAVTVTRVVALTPDQVRQRLIDGPRPTPVRSVPLRLLRVPTPERITGDGLAPGDRWMFHYPGSSHGSGGHTITEVEAVAPDRVEFGVVTDSAITARWLVWDGAAVGWRPVGDGRTEVRLTLAYHRRLDPSWYFGPVQLVLMHEGAGYMLDALALR